MSDHTAEPLPLAATAGSAATDRIRGLFTALWRRVAASRRAAARRHAARKLLDVEPHLLRDIGLTHADLHRAIHGADPGA